ncbi:SPOR domain-containing protein [Capnocytophaga sp.]|uniref:SPOR domain-containing protein n=1 Tax=Capnocytophaga sp. TaxID=44737 RepID=UPI0026DBF6BB|nr:SPOR domain-containing protein [Capnocytophaga sp.]MDO5105383.1 SPOR domain-containing protein [Capnocytophaga sp.]
MKKLLLSLSLLCLVFELYGQKPSVDFKIRYEAHLKGEMKIIGNNIVNRSEKRQKANVTFDDRTAASKVNDQFDMQYIDIDDDDATFSSSSASFEPLQKAGTKVVYAGLYWAGTYPYASGVFKKQQYKVKNPSREAFHSVLVKTPVQQQYVSVSGEVVFDGIDVPALSGVAPYLCYADITHLVANYSAEGEYTIANVRAANGQIAGGVAAGWALVLVYENSQLSEKKLITYDGFSTIHQQAQKIAFKGFETPAQGEFQTSIMGAVLEGDLQMAGDEVQISVPTTEKALDLENATRRKKNFFNSAITENGTIVSGRNPAGLNTLGFDIFRIDLTEAYKELIPNAATELDLTFTRSADQYYLFLTALQIESVLQKKKSIPLLTLSSAELDKGYYVVVGVFTNINNVKKQQKHLEAMGYDTKVFFRAEKNLHYIYTQHFDTYKQAVEQAEFIRKDTDIYDAWILNVKEATP